MSDLASRIRAVHLHVSRLVADRDVAKRRIGVLEHELREHHRNAEVLEARVAALEQENEVLRRAAAYLSQANLPGKVVPARE